MTTFGPLDLACRRCRSAPGRGCVDLALRTPLGHWHEERRNDAALATRRSQRRHRRPGFRPWPDEAPNR